MSCLSIPLQIIDVLPSTSQYVQEQCKQGVTPPFAVAALEQHAGRGRRGHVWQSPRGNLYISLALPVLGLPVAAGGLIPLYVSWMMAQWLSRAYGIRATVKWPNDLLFAGRKLGGILCEGVIVNKEWQYVVVGIGLNVLKAPADLPDQEAIDLRTVLQREDFSVADIARQLVQYFEQTWDVKDIPNTPQFLPQYLIEQGQRWQETQTGEQATVNEVQRDGALALRQQNGETLSLVSAEHHWRWWLQCPERHTRSYAVADLGNTLWKLATYRGETPEPQQTFSGVYSAAGFASLTAPLDMVFAGAVNHRALPEFMAYMQSRNVHVVFLPKRWVRVSQSVYDMKTLGIDRMAQLEGCLGLWPKAAGFITISCGTAMTVDVINAERQHCGGWILPGLTTAWQTLHEKTAALPQIAATEREQLVKRFQTGKSKLGTQTHEAMVFGALFQLTATIEQLRQQYPQAQLVLTGGDSQWLADLFPKAVVASDLTLQGFRMMALGGML